MIRRVTIGFEGDEQAKCVLSQFIWEALSACEVEVTGEEDDTLIVTFPSVRELDQFRMKRGVAA
jgi:hypothetical protein